MLHPTGVGLPFVLRTFDPILFDLIVHRFSPVILRIGFLSNSLEAEAHTAAGGIDADHAKLEHVAFLDLRALLEEGLRWAIGKRKRRHQFTMRDASVGGKGVQPGGVEGDWAAIRDRIYDGRGS